MEGVAGVIIGVLLLLIGLTGEGALHEHILQQSGSLQMLFYDLEIVGELLVLVAPIVFFFLLPAHRGQTPW